MLSHANNSRIFGRDPKHKLGNSKFMSNQHTINHSYNRVAAPLKGSVKTNPKALSIPRHHTFRAGGVNNSKDTREKSESALLAKQFILFDKDKGK